MIGILHLSDFHFQANLTDHPVDETVLTQVSESICGVINSQTLHVKTLLVIVSGDIAFSGKHEEYQVALNFFNKLKSDIERESSLETTFLYIPGNHDNNYLLLSEDQRSVSNTEYQDFAERSEIQSGFGVFLRNFGAYDINLQEPINCINLPLNHAKVKINLINSGLSSSLENSSTELNFPTNSLIRLESDQDNADLSISIMHHPIYAFMESCRHQIKDKIEDTTDLLFVGHEHKSDSASISGFSHSHVNIINGEKIDIQDFSDSGFNFARVDIYSDELITFQYKWDKESKKFVETKCSDKQKLVNPRRKRFSKQINEEFYKFLQDPDGPFLKHKFGKMQLKEIFVYPNIAITNQEDNRPKELQVLDGSNIINEVLQHPVSFIIGSDFSGKTTLCKMLFSDLLSAGKFPLFIAGEKISSPKIDSIEKLIKKEFGEIYAHPDVNTYFQEAKGNKVLVLDSFEKIKLSGTKRIELVENLLKFYNNIIITSSEEIDPEFSAAVALFNIDGTQSLYCRIRPFGHLQRNQLVRKWLDSYDEDREANLFQRQIEVERILNDILDKRLLPAYPFFVVSILQTMATTTAEINSSSVMYFGSYSAIYRLLITSATLRNLPLNLDMNLLDQLQQELAYKMYVEHKRRYSEEEINNFSQEFLNNRLVNVNYSSIVRHFLNNRLWDNRYASIGFAYDFIYYYYLASYFQDQIHEVNIHEHVSACFECIGNEGNKSIIRFLIYVANPQVQHILFDKLIEKADTLYSGALSLDLIEQTRFINDININLPSKKLENKPEDNRTEMLKKRDEIEDDCFENESFDEVENENPWYEPIEAVNTLLLLGDLLKNQSGTLDKDQKIDLVNVSFGLTSRILSSGLNFFANERELLENQITSFLSEQVPSMSDRKIEEKTKIILTQFIFIYILGVLTILREYLGHEKLSLVFSEVRKSKDLADVLLFDFVVRQHSSFHNFPETELDSILQQYNKRPFLLRIIAIITFTFISLYPTDYKVKARVSKKIGCKPPKPKMIAGN